MGNVSDGMKSLCEDIAAAHEDRKRDIKRLIRNVSSLRKDFRKKEEEIRSDLAEASKIWKRMKQALKTKRTESK